MAGGSSEATDYRGHSWRDSAAPDEVIWGWRVVGGGGGGWGGVRERGDRKTGRQRGERGRQLRTLHVCTWAGVVTSVRARSAFQREGTLTLSPAEKNPGQD